MYAKAKMKLQYDFIKFISRPVATVSELQGCLKILWTMGLDGEIYFS